MLAKTSTEPVAHNLAQSHPYKVAVIGAGPAGLAAAARLAKAGISVEVFEAGRELGGLARSLTLWGRQVELSAHIFRSNDSFVNDLWREGAGELVEIKLRRGIFNGNRVIEYPMTPLRILRGLGIVKTAQCVLGLLRARLFNHSKAESKHAEDWMIRHYGKPLHDRFLRDYAEKLWGVPCAHIHAAFPQFLFYSADDTKKGPQSFLYPRLGNSSVWNTLGKNLEEKGVVIHRNTPVKKITVVDKTVQGLMVNGKPMTFDHVISTMPLGLLARLTLPKDSPAIKAGAVLKARSTVLIYLKAESSSQSNFNWLSVYPAHFRLGRITDFGQWLKLDNDSTVYCLEFWCDRADDFWNQSDEALVAIAEDEINQTGIVGRVVVLDSHVERLPGTHPVFSLESQPAIKTINDELSGIQGLSTVGRQGAHGVLGMGESMEAACEVSDRITSALTTLENS